MKSGTTILLFASVLLIGGYIWFVDRRAETTDQKKEAARLALRVEPSRVTRLSIVSDDLQVTCERKDKKWRITSPVNASADAGAVEQVLEALRTLARSDVITQREQDNLNISRDEYGLSLPRVRIALEQDQRQLVLLVGRDAPLGGHLYMQLEGRDDIIVAETNLLSALPRSVTELRDRRLFQGYPSDAARLDLKRADGFVQLAKSGGEAWSVQKPVQGRADAAAVQNLIDQFFDVRVLDFVADSVAAASLYGLDEPVAQVTIAVEPSGAEQTLLLGKALDTNSNEIYASLQGVDTVCAISNSILATLRVSVDDLRDRRLLALSAYDISYIKLEQGDKALTLQSTNATDWFVVEPRQYGADASRVQLLLSAWMGIRVENFHDDYETNLNALGLSPPAFKISFARTPPVRGASEQPSPASRPFGDQATVAVSSLPPVNGLLTVGLGDENIVCEIPAGTIQSLTLEPLQYRDRKLVQLEPSQVLSLHIQNGAVPQAVQREGTNEFRTADAGADVDAEAVLNVLSALRRLSADQLIEEDPKDLARYGLQSPTATLTIGLSGEEGIGKTILFGAESGGGEAYALVKGQDVIFTIAKAVRDKLLAPLYKIPTLEKTTDDHGNPAPAESPP